MVMLDQRRQERGGGGESKSARGGRTEKRCDATKRVSS